MSNDVISHRTFGARWRNQRDEERFDLCVETRSCHTATKFIKAVRQPRCHPLPDWLTIQPNVHHFNSIAADIMDGTPARSHLGEA